MPTCMAPYTCFCTSYRCPVACYHFRRMHRAKYKKQRLMCSVLLRDIAALPMSCARAAAKKKAHRAGSVGSHRVRG